MPMKPLTLYPHEIRRLQDAGNVLVWRPIDRIGRHGRVTRFGPSNTPGYDWHFRCNHGLWQDYRDADLMKLAPHPPGSERWVREAWRLVAWPGDDWEALRIEYRLDSTLSPDLINVAVIKHDAWDSVERLADQCVDDCLKAGLDIDEPLIFDGPPPTRWRSPVTMPRWASRYTVQVAGVDARQVHAVTEDEARDAGHGLGCIVKSERFGRYMSAGQYAFANQWQFRYGTWEANPWAWAYRVERKG